MRGLRHSLLAWVLVVSQELKNQANKDRRRRIPRPCLRLLAPLPVVAARSQQQHEMLLTCMHACSHYTASLQFLLLTAISSVTVTFNMMSSLLNLSTCRISLNSNAKCPRGVLGPCVSGCREGGYYWLQSCRLAAADHET